MVTANYKLTFDALRNELSGRHLWLLVADTRGINVWCAAGKGTFSTEEIAYQVRRARLDQVVSHRQLILPQLGGVGVSALDLKKQCGFKGVFGPIKAAHLPTCLDNSMQVDESMRTITFNLAERTVLIPVEVVLLYKPVLLTLAILTVLGGIGPDIYSLSAAFSRAMTLLWATLFGIGAGAVATPLFLPWLAGRQFWIKGLQPGLLAAIAIYLLNIPTANLAASLGLGLWTLTLSSYLAMNFTGSTPYTSLSGVEYEMRNGLPVQIAGSFIALAAWLISPFL